MCTKWRKSWQSKSLCLAKVHGAKYNEWTLGTWLFNASLRKSSGSVIYSVRIRCAKTEVKSRRAHVVRTSLSLLSFSLFPSTLHYRCNHKIVRSAVSQTPLSLTFFFLFLSLFPFVAASEEFERVDDGTITRIGRRWKAEAFSSSLCSSSRRSHPSHPEISADSHVRGYDYATLRAALTRGSVHAYIRHCA